jgi:acyl-CoA reductase-like NAD-dependent aldehyde dehydrogenase
MINNTRFEGLKHLIKEAEEAGANVIGGEPYEHVYLENGSYFTPTLVAPVRSHMRIAQDEGIFILF